MRDGSAACTYGRGAWTAGRSILWLVAALSMAACSSAASSSASGSPEGGGAGGDDGGMPSDASTSEASQGDATPGTDAPAEGAAPGADGGGTSHDAGSDASAAGALDYMIGIKCNGEPTAPGTLQGWLGRKTDVAGTTITTTSYIGANNAGYKNTDGSLPLLEVSFPLLSIFGEMPAYTDLAQAASGAYDATYEAMAKDLAAFPNPLVSARIGWEFNGNWYAWSNGVGTNATYANYVGAFQHAATLIKKHNPNVLIQWNIAWGQPDPTPYWPGAYDASKNPGGVDVISIDFYQANISQYNNGGKQSTWAMAQSGTTISVDWMVNFAKQKGVKIALSEYGAGSPSSGGLGSGKGLNDGAWTSASVAWIQSLPPGLFLWTNWSDDQPADDIVTPGSNPAEQAAWSAAWTGTHFGGTWWKGTPPPSAP